MKTGDLVYWETKALKGFRIVVEVWPDQFLPQLLVKVPGEDGKTYPVMACDCRLATAEETAQVSDSLTDKKEGGSKKKTVTEYLAEKEKRRTEQE